MSAPTRLNIDELKARETPHADHALISIKNRGETEEEIAEGERFAALVRAALDDYLKIFAAPEPSKGKPGMMTGSLLCRGCDSPLDGFFGTFRYGITHGEGRCTKCGYPCRANHYVKDDQEADLIDFAMILQYHPDGLVMRRSE